MKKKRIEEITELDAVEAARLTGYDFTRANRYEWGIRISGDTRRRARHQPENKIVFCIKFGGSGFECGLIGIMTPNFNLIVDFLRERGYDI